jgi:hypothetical protein
MPASWIGAVHPTSRVKAVSTPRRWNSSALRANAPDQASRRISA